MKCGPFVFVFGNGNLRLRRVRLVRAAAAAKAFINTPAGKAYDRSVPQISGSPPGLVREIAACFTAGPAESPPGGVALFEGATVTASGVLLTAEGCLVRESLINTQLWGEFGVFVRDESGAPLQIKVCPLTTQRRLAKTPYVLMKQTYDANYGHWLIECLPRLESVASCFDLSRCKFIVAKGHGAMQAVYRDSLGFCGVAPEQVVELDYTAVHIDTLIYPLPITEHPWIKSPRVVPFLEAIAAKGRAASAPKRIYVSRNKGKTRRLANEAAVIAILRKHDFAVVHPEALDFSRQVTMFSNAELVVGNYGANLSNVVFAPSGVTLFALTSEFMQDDFFWDLMDHKKGPYYSLHGQAIDGGKDFYADFEIDLNRFAAILTGILSTLAPSCNPSLS